ncbi:MAG: tripartite tricarboxylate transporter substrate binding protein [Betaproteobacteria bacterium]|nr:tripartite tricarboxylate transporter substrate binding protein [Betaproteobacteria bacterium]
MTRFVVSIFSVGLMVVGTGAVSSQDYPNKPLRIVTTPVGGGSDLLSRLIAQGISGPLGQSVIVDNRPTAVIAEIVAKAPADGYTLLATSPGLWVLPLFEKTRYDPVRDFSPISLTARAPLLLVVHPSLPVKSVKELIDLAKAKPGVLNYAAGSIGTPPHLAGELFKVMAGVNIVYVPYKSTGPAVIGLLSGQAEMMIDTGPSQVPHIKSGKLRALAVTTAKPSALFPDLPTLAATVPGYEMENTNVMFAPAKTPAAIITRLNQEIARVLNRPEVKQRFSDVGTETVGSSPEQLAATVKSDMVKWRKLIKDAGLRRE